MKKILIIDDEEDIRGILTEFCNFLGYYSKSCADGKEALEILQNEDFDIIISDIRMEDIDGDKFVREVKKRNKNIPIIICSGYIDDKTKEKFLKLGINDYLEKPFKLKNFKEILEKY